jgi:hypothetical protein
MSRKKTDEFRKTNHWTREQIIERATKLFGQKGKYNAEELSTALNNLVKNPPEGEHHDEDNK